MSGMSAQIIPFGKRNGERPVRPDCGWQALWTGLLPIEETWVSAFDYKSPQQHAVALRKMAATFLRQEVAPCVVDFQFYGCKPIQLPKRKFMPRSCLHEVVEMVALRHESIATAGGITPTMEPKEAELLRNYGERTVYGNELVVRALTHSLNISRLGQHDALRETIQTTAAARLYKDQLPASQQPSVQYILAQRAWELFRRELETEL